MSNEDAPWKQFEKAVAVFMTAIGNGAKVTHDVILPDQHTGHPRQRDVWVEWAFNGHFPVKALVSCKRWKNALNQKDMDHFNGEFLSSGAQIGIIYSKAGFNDHALEKGRALGFHCCRLYENESADIPESLSLGLAYNFRPHYRISVTGDTKVYDFKTWGQVLGLPTDENTVLESLIEAFDAHQANIDNTSDRWLRAKHGSAFEVETSREGLPKLTVRLDVADRAFRAKVEWYLLNGSYNVTAGDFKGSQVSPCVDTQSAHPGPGWKEVNEIPNIMPKPCLAMFMQADARAQLVEFGKTAFPPKATG